MVSSVLRNTSQVERTKKHSRIDSENKSGKRNTGHQNHLTVCFYVLPYTVRKHFWLNRMLYHGALTNQVCVIV